MREAIGGAFIFNIVITFVIIIMLLLVGSIGYSKAFKVKNKIINVIEKYEGFTEDAKKEIRQDLAKIGYRVSFSTNKCPDVDDASAIYGNNNTGDYHYCVYEFKSSRGYYYHVKAFMHFDLPIIGGFLEFPIAGETRLMYDTIGS